LVTEATTSSPLPYASAEKLAATPVSAGTISIQADVTVTYAIG
jgi:uncharacterized protein YggE